MTSTRDTPKGNLAERLDGLLWRFAARALGVDEKGAAPVKV